MGKTIVFCADGTWNGPGQDDDRDGVPDVTNVYKLFCGLEGQPTPDSLTKGDEQEKELRDGASLLQVAKYIHGVGDSRNPIHKLMGGAFGAGMIARIVRGYTFISRNYDAGDAIVIVGFSRGAYTARALAGLVASRGLLAKPLTVDHEDAYRAGANAWYQYRAEAKRKTGALQSLVESLSDLPAFVSRRQLKRSDFVAVPAIAALGVWDTVGALGLPHYIREPGADAFRFADTRLSPKVGKGFHAVSRDERRQDFIPTLWDAAPNVEQVLFAGAHADVGGGYPAANGESGLSDIGLEWMIGKLAGVGVRIGTPVYAPFRPDPLGTAHEPWRSLPFNDPARIAGRKFPTGAGRIPEHPSVTARKGQMVRAHPGEALARYR